MHPNEIEIIMTSDWDPEPIDGVDTDVAYTEGWEEAERQGGVETPLNLCPYPEGTPQHDSWKLGYTDFLDDH